MVNLLGLFVLLLPKDPVLKLNGAYGRISLGKILLLSLYFSWHAGKLVHLLWIQQHKNRKDETLHFQNGFLWLNECLSIAIVIFECRVAHLLALIRHCWKFLHEQNEESQLQTQGSLKAESWSKHLVWRSMLFLKVKYKVFGIFLKNLHVFLTTCLWWWSYENPWEETKKISPFYSAFMHHFIDLRSSYWRLHDSELCKMLCEITWVKSLWLNVWPSRKHLNSHFVAVATYK